MTAEDIRAVSPVLEQYAEKTIVGDLWQRPICRAETAALLPSLL